MAIEGLERIPVANPTTDEEVIVDALERVGLVRDDNRETVLRSTQADIDNLEGSGQGQDYPWTPDKLVSLVEVIHAFNTGEYRKGRKVPDIYVDDSLWTPGTKSHSYTAAELGRFDCRRSGANVHPHVRRALYSNDIWFETPSLLHFTRQAYDRRFYEGDKEKETQPEALRRMRREYEADHKGFGLIPLDAKSLVMIALIRRIKGEAMPLTQGEMRDATLEPKLISGRSRGYKNDGHDTYYIGTVRINTRKNGQLELIPAYDQSVLPREYSGVGLSAGPKDIEPSSRTH